MICTVASFTDAWIETVGIDVLDRVAKVASFTDAWIETRQRYSGHHSCYVASFTDAWIETWKAAVYYAKVESHLLQMRGLKHL